MYQDSYETTGSNVEAAIELALNALGIEDRDTVEIEILEEGPAPGEIVGWGGPRARVRLTRKEAPAERPAAPAPPRPEPARAEVAPAPPVEPLPRAMAPQDEAVSEPSRPSGRTRRNLRKAKGKKKPPRPTVVIGEEPPAPPVAAMGLEPSVARPRPAYEASEADNELFRRVVEEVLEAIGISHEVRYEHADYQRAFIDLPRHEAGGLIGRRGAAIDALEHLVGRMVSQQAGRAVPVQVDVNEYRLQKEEELREEAGARARQVLQDGKDQHLSPMNPRERRVVHLTIETMEGLATFTVGDGPARHVVISRVNPNGA